MLATAMCTVTLGAADGGPAPRPTPRSETMPRPHCGRARRASREPDLGQVHEDMPASARARQGADFAAEIPVYVHVVTDGAVGSLTAKQINDQIRVLNVTFAGGEGGATPASRSAWPESPAPTTPAWFNANPGGVDEHSMKQALPGRAGRAQPLLNHCRRLPRLGLPAGHRHQARARRTWTAWWSTGSPSRARRPPTRAATTRARRRPTRSATGSTSSTPSSAAATPRATSWTTPRSRRRRRRAARRARTPARRPGTRSDPQLHGLLLRHLLHAVHAGPGAADEATPGCCSGRLRSAGQLAAQHHHALGRRAAGDQLAGHRDGVVRRGVDAEPEADLVFVAAPVERSGRDLAGSPTSQTS